MPVTMPRSEPSFVTTMQLSVLRAFIISAAACTVVVCSTRSGLRGRSRATVLPLPLRAGRHCSGTGWRPAAAAWRGSASLAASSCCLARLCLSRCASRALSFLALTPGEAPRPGEALLLLSEDTRLDGGWRTLTGCMREQTGGETGRPRVGRALRDTSH